MMINKRHGQPEQEVHCGERGLSVAVARGKCRDDGMHHKAAGRPVQPDGRRRADSADPCVRGRSDHRAIYLHETCEPDELSLVQGCQKDSARHDIGEAAAPRRGIQRGRQNF